jgi:hypothetical protein
MKMNKTIRNTTQNFILVSLLLCWTTVITSAFSSLQHSAAHPKTSRTTTTLQMGYEMGESESGEQTEIVSMAMKMTGILAIKTIKDVINYPPMFLDNLSLERQAERESQELPKTNSFIMFSKFIGVLVFKSLHDSIYYPATWTRRMIQCSSIEECDL